MPDPDSTHVSTCSSFGQDWAGAPSSMVANLVDLLEERVALDVAGQQYGASRSPLSAAEPPD